MSKPFWEIKALADMTSEEWESLCDGCGKCCLNKLEDEDTGDIYWTDIACRLFDSETCRCKDYSRRNALVPDCVVLTPEKVSALSWLPRSCAYRRLADGRTLAWWHPLISGTPNTVVAAGMSARGRVLSEQGMDVEDYEYHLSVWPNDDED